jgi:hypothetical protein
MVASKSLVLTLAFAGCAWPQMVQYGITAGGGAAAGVAGKTISDKMTSVLGGVAEATGKAGSGGAATYVARPVEPDFSNVAPAPRASTAKSSSGRRQASQAVSAQPMTPSTPSRLEPPYSLRFWVPPGQVVETATVERFSQVKLGEDLENLAVQLGTPSSRVMIPGTDGRLWQRVKYKANSRDVGVIYVADGKVVEIVPARI